MIATKKKECEKARRREAKTLFPSSPHPFLPSSLPRCSGVVMVELIVSSMVATILVITVGLLLSGNHRAWLRTYESVHGSTPQSTEIIIATFGSIGRRANRASYCLYDISQGLFTPAVPQSGHPDGVVSGDAVEFRYWDVPLDQTDSHGLMDASKLATAYALFYLDGRQLKVDYGAYPPGAVPAGGGARNTTGVTTVVLAENVDDDGAGGPFSHSTVAGAGQGSVRLNVILTDPDNGETTKVMTSALIRNIWPR